MENNMEIDDLKEYMFYGKNMVKYLKSESHRIHVDTLQYSKKIKNIADFEKKSDTNTNNTNINSIDPIKEDVFSPKEKDGLFWCYYVMKNGFKDYEFPNTTSYVNEKSLKIKCIDELRLHKQQLKNKKIRNIKEICEDDLVNKQQITIKTFTALCVISNINFIYIERRKCYPCICEEDEPIFVIFKNNSSYNCEMNVSKEKANEYMSKYFIVDNVEKPLKSMSGYKSQELIEMCKKLGLNFESQSEGENKKDGKKKKITKEFMYEKLVQLLS